MPGLISLTGTRLRVDNFSIRFIGSSQGVSSIVETNVGALLFDVIPVRPGGAVKRQFFAND